MCGDCNAFLMAQYIVNIDAGTGRRLKIKIETQMIAGSPITLF